jgi:hypothetical protein
LKRSLAALNLFPGRDEQNPEYMLVTQQRQRFTRKWAAGSPGPYGNPPTLLQRMI